MELELNDVINHLKESLEAPLMHRGWVYAEHKLEQIQLLIWLEDYKQIKSECVELKRLLKLAVDDIGKLKNCEKYPFCGGCPKESEPLCKWKYHDEAMKLLEGKEMPKRKDDAE